MADADAKNPRSLPANQTSAVTLDGQDLTDAIRLLRRLTAEVSGSSLHESVTTNCLHIAQHPTSSKLTEAARKAFLARKRRAQLFPKAMFRESAWDMLLALYIFDHTGPRFTVSRLTEFAGGSATTALRWLDFLVGRGLVQRFAHPNDARMSFVDLTDESRSALDTYFSETTIDQ